MRIKKTIKILSLSLIIPLTLLPYPTQKKKNQHTRVNVQPCQHCLWCILHKAGKIKQCLPSRQSNFPTHTLKQLQQTYRILNLCKKNSKILINGSFYNKDNLQRHINNLEHKILQKKICSKKEIQKIVEIGAKEHNKCIQNTKTKLVEYFRTAHHLFGLSDYQDEEIMWRIKQVGDAITVFREHYTEFQKHPEELKKYRTVFFWLQRWTQSIRDFKLRCLPEFLKNLDASMQKKS